MLILEPLEISPILALHLLTSTVAGLESRDARGMSNLTMGTRSLVGSYQRASLALYSGTEINEAY